ncbi:LrgB family protein [Tatumella sp. JGM118]|uniref:LrgB family protein n=1 Tax=Tatumella terrea TaxID=419007 RepID=A0ABW1W2G6_9GAMM|nr:LrgB family protein [Tatumella sp. JGM118]MBS0909923.1 LrgB family protein [Tatumella sp. JGM118]
MSDFIVSVLCFVLTLLVYYVNKRLYTRWRTLILMPLVMTPMVLVVMLLITHITWKDYIADSHWLIWLLGPATLAFAVPVYENMAIIKRHWMSLTAGVITATLVAVCTSVWLARLFTLPVEIQRSLAVRSITTPFALAAAKPVGGQPDLVALFVVLTGVFGMAMGDFLFLRIAIKQGMAKGAGLGAASHGAGTARAYQIGPQEGVVSSLVMMLAGVVTVLAAPIIGHVMWTLKS